MIYKMKMPSVYTSTLSTTLGNDCHHEMHGPSSCLDNTRAAIGREQVDLRCWELNRISCDSWEILLR